MKNLSKLVLLKFQDLKRKMKKIALNILTWTSQNQEGVNKFQISNHKSQTNFKLQCPNGQNQFVWNFVFIHWDLFVI